MVVLFCSSFSWEEVPAHGGGAGTFRLLAVGSQGELELLEAGPERSSQASLLRVSRSPAGRVLDAIAAQTPGE